MFGGPEWTEQAAWVGGQPERRIRLGWPRLGTRRTDVSFTSGVNIADQMPVTYDGDAYAQVVVALGSGEGQARRRATDAVRDGRLRLEDVLDMPTIKGQDQLAAKARSWFTSVAVLDEGGYEVVRRDTTRREHDVVAETSIDRIARELTIWMAARDSPGRPTQHTSNL